MLLLWGLLRLLLLLFCIVMRLLLCFIVIVNKHFLLLLLLLGLLLLLNMNVVVCLGIIHQNSCILLTILLLLLFSLIRWLMLLLLNDHLRILGSARSFHIVVWLLWLLLNNSHMIRLGTTSRCCGHIYLLILTLWSGWMRYYSNFVHPLISLIWRLMWICSRYKLCRLLCIPVNNLLLLSMSRSCCWPIDCCWLLLSIILTVWSNEYLLWMSLVLLQVDLLSRLLGLG